MSLCFQVLASGSKGNCILVAADGTAVLVDMGLSGREMQRRLEHTPFAPQDIDAVIVTHEHRDHVLGVGVISRRYDLPVYLTQGTLENLPSSTGQLAHLQIFQPGKAFTIGRLQFQAFPTSHDAAEPVGLVVENGHRRLGICTDLGVVTHLVQTRLNGCHGLVLEANHDPDLLINGPYPWHLKQRIHSRHGHLSNQESRRLLEKLYHPGLQAVVFAHLSQTNNRVDLVSQTCCTLAADNGWNVVSLAIAIQDRPTALFQL